MLGMVAVCETVDESKIFSYKVVGDVSDKFLIEQKTKRNEVWRKRKSEALARALELITVSLNDTQVPMSCMVRSDNNIFPWHWKKPNSIGQKSPKHDCSQNFLKSSFLFPLTGKWTVWVSYQYNSYGLQMEANWNYTCAYILGFAYLEREETVGKQFKFWTENSFILTHQDMFLLINRNILLLLMYKKEQENVTLHEYITFFDLLSYVP